MRKGLAKPELIVAVGVIGLAAVVGQQTAEIPVTPIYSKIGPTIFPVMVTGGLLLLGAALLVAAFAGGWTDSEEAAEVPPDWRALFWLALGLVLNVALIKWLGFVLSSVLLFCCVARAFGSTRLVRDIAVAAILAVLTYVGFDRILGFSIGAGILEGIL